MAYIQITTKCNMRCAHCCFRCEPGKGEDMSVSTFIKALTLDSCITIGGGEPTIHPQFEKLLMLALGNPNIEYVYVITNGKHKQRALMLAEMAKKEILGVELSQDEYHEPISQEVIEAFDGRYRNISEPLSAGRWLDAVGGEEECPCPDLLIQPDGKIKPCGCESSPVIGHVDTGVLDLDYNTGECYRDNSYQYSA